MISIVMPIYNTGLLLYESIESVRAQTYEDWELILIDDASDDEITADIISEYTMKDKRIIHHRLNSRIGAGEARNTGLKKAKGKYVFFLDADDCFDFDLLRIMYHDISVSDADMCICSYRTFDDSDAGTNTVFKLKTIEGVTDRVFSIKELPETGFLFWNPAPWNKIYNAMFLKNSGIYFQDLSSSNDVYFSFMCAAKARRIVYSSSSKPLINYRKNTATQISSNRNPMNLNRACEKLINEECIKQDVEMLKRLVLFWMLFIMTEIEWFGDEREKSDAYIFVSDYFEKNLQGLAFDDARNNVLLKMYISEKNRGWMKSLSSYGAQLKWNQDKIIDLFKKYQGQKIVIWGYGKRGQAFEHFWNENMHSKIFITDKKNRDVGIETGLGNMIISTDEAMETADIIAASNNAIYESLSGCGKELIQIEKYCPF